jgi:hypothetical protein
VNPALEESDQRFSFWREAQRARVRGKKNHLQNFAVENEKND